jgi:ribonuclease P/MRP protein subunit RPP1
MHIINTTNLEEAKKQIKKSEPPVIIQAQDDNFNRKILEYGKFDVLLSVESGNRKNSLRQIDSGLNHVLAKIAAKNKIAISIDLNEIKKLSKSQKAQRLSKIIQNIKICRKAKTKIKVINTNDKKNTSSLLLSLGASTTQIKFSLPL